VVSAISGVIKGSEVTVSVEPVRSGDMVDRPESEVTISVGLV